MQGRRRLDMQGRRIFISYRRQDSAGYARALKEYLDVSLPSTDELFMDVDSLTTGQDFRANVSQFLDTCDVFLAIIGPRWAEIKKSNRGEDYMKMEIETALQSSALVVPVLVGGANLPTNLPRSLRPLTHHQAIELLDTAWSHGLTQLQAFLESVPPGSRARSDEARYSPSTSTDSGGSKDLIEKARVGLDRFMREGPGGSSSFLLVGCAAEQNETRQAVAGWMRSKKLSMQVWRSAEAEFVQGKVGSSKLRRASATDAAITIRMAPQGQDLMVQLSADPWLWKAAGTIVGFVVSPLLAGAPIYGSVRQFQLLYACKSFFNELALRNRWKLVAAPAETGGNDGGDGALGQADSDGTDAAP